MKIFITGGSGFIGKHLVRRICETNHEVVCLVRENSKHEPLRKSGAKIVHGDLMDQASLHKAMEGMDCLIHLAGIYEMWLPDNKAFYDVNVTGTRNVMEVASLCGVQKVIHMSTIAVYGKPLDRPFTEDCQPGPVLYSEYGRTKACGDRIVMDVFQNHNIPVIILYPGIVLGPGDDRASGEYIQRIIRRKVPSTIYHNSIQTYIYVGDVVDAIIKSLSINKPSIRKYFLGRYCLNGKEYADLISKISGVQLPLIHFPDFFVSFASYIFTGISQITRSFPMWGLSIDAARTLKNGFQFDGGLAEKELGIQYTSIDDALSEAIEDYLGPNRYESEE